MFNLIDNLRRRNSNFPLDSAKGEGYPSTHNKILTVNFSKIKRFPDNDIASMCTVVCASDGSLGSISHLTISQNPVEFAKALKNFWKTPASLVIFGGNDDIDGSNNFFNNICGELLSKGFKISATSSGGMGLYRHGILSGEKVLVRVSNYSESIKYDEELYF